MWHNVFRQKRCVTLGHCLRLAQTKRCSFEISLLLLALFFEGMLAKDLLHSNSLKKACFIKSSLTIALIVISYLIEKGVNISKH